MNQELENRLYEFLSTVVDKHGEVIDGYAYRAALSLMLEMKPEANNEA